MFLSTTDMLCIKIHWGIHPIVGNTRLYKCFLVPARTMATMYVHTQEDVLYVPQGLVKHCVILATGSGWRKDEQG